MDAALATVDRWWRAANYLSVGQIYLRDNPLLRRPLQIEDVKPRLLGHWGTCPGINLLWAHLNRLIVDRGIGSLFVCGPGHGGPAAIANPWLEGAYTELYPDVTMDEIGMTRLFRQFSTPGGVPSHAGAPTPGSIHEGGELGYSLAHAHGAAFDAPDELVVCMIGDGEAETGALATSWHSPRFVDPGRDGWVLPVLHLNGWKIANPTVLARLPERRLRRLLQGHGYEPWFVSGDEPSDVHDQLAQALDEVADLVAERRAEPGHRGETSHGTGGDVVWPMIVLRTPKGWTGPAELDGTPIEGHFRSHQVPVGHGLGEARLLAELERWMRSYGPGELFDDVGRPVGLDALRPEGDLRMGANPRANSRERSADLVLPRIDDHVVDIDGDDGRRRRTGAMDAAGTYLRDVIAANPDRFRLMAPDEVASNHLDAVFEVTDRVWGLERRPNDEHLAARGRVMEVLSEHLCQGWLEGYVLTGRHGVFTSYEAFIHIVDSMFNQHAKWLDESGDVSWRRPVPSLNYLLSSHVWRQDHNGFSHQDPGFLDVVANKQADVVRIYLPPDANTLLVTLERCLASRHLVNVVVAGKHPEPNHLRADEAAAHLEAGAAVWPWAGNETGDGPPDVVLGCAGDVPTMETVAAAELLRDATDLRVRVVNVIDLMTLQSDATHPHGMSDPHYDALFPPGVPTVFAFHGYPSLVHRLTYKRHHHADLHVHGFVEEGTTTTPFDMAVRNRIDRYHLALAVARHVDPAHRGALSGAVERWTRQLDEHRRYIRTAGEDPPEIADWTYRRADHP